MAKISGILTDGAGQIINDCTIELYAKKTTSKVLTQTQAFKVANNGSYTMNVLPCEYDVSLIINGFPKKRLGTIQVYSDSLDGTLNDFLLNPSESEITPSFLQQVIEERKNAQLAANDARNSASTIDVSNFFPYKGYLGAININTLGAIQKGVYFQNVAENALLTQGYPINAAGSLLVLPTFVGEQGCVQIYTIFTSARQFMRNYNGDSETGHWEPWVEQITTANVSAYIVESYANGNFWYNVYSNGFIEQSGTINVKTLKNGEINATLVNLLVPMKTQYYSVSIDKINNGLWGDVTYSQAARNLTDFLIASFSMTSSGEAFVRWTVRGY